MQQPQDQNESWVEAELATLRLGDKRLVKRAKRIVSDFSKLPNGSIPEFSQNWAATKAVYAFMKSDKVETGALLSAQRDATLARMADERLVICVQDGTDVELSHYGSIAGQGRLSFGNGKRTGFLVHTTLAMSAAGVPLGVLDQQHWIRPMDAPSKAGTSRYRPIEEKESYVWLRGLSNSSEGLPADNSYLFVSDRGSDIIEYFLAPRPANVHLLVRATYDRILLDSDLKLLPTLRQTAVAGHIAVEVAATDTRPARTATCNVHFRQVTIAPPNINRLGAAAKVTAVTLWAILLEEVQPPAADQPPLQWCLLTTQGVNAFDQACQMIDFYTLRWVIERFHFVLKTGCRLEERRLGSVSSMERLLAITNIVAWRILWLTYLGRSAEPLPCTVALADHEWKALYTIIHRSPVLPETPPTLQEAVIWIAQLGGFLARKGDGYPGPAVLWKGWQRLNDHAEMWLILHPPQPDDTYG